MMMDNKDITVLLNNISQGNLARSLIVYLQPTINMANGHCVGGEALVRGLVNGKLIFPDSFIGILEKNNDILKIGVFVLQTAIQFAKKYELQHQSNFSLSSNFSPIEINDRGVVEKIKNITDATGYPSHKVTIEITETAISLSPQGRENAQWLQKQGFVIAWDDISSLDGLNKNSHEFSSDVIKLDRGLMNKECLQLTQEIILQCKLKKLQIVAEGVESRWQRDWLLEQGVTVCQGYYYSAPVSTHDFASQYFPSHASLTL